MKRLLSGLISTALICAALLSTASAADSGGLPSWTKQSVCVGEGGTYTTRREITSSEALDMLNKLLASAGSKVTRPEDTQVITWIDENDGNSIYQVLRSGQQYYLYGKNGCRPIAEADLFAFLKACGNSIYTYRKIPIATALLEGAQRTLTVKESTYSYRKLDGKFYQPIAVTDDSPGYLMSGDTIPLPMINAPKGTVTCTGVRILSEGKTVFDGTGEEARGYKLTGTGSHKVEASYSFTSDDFRGSVTYAYTLIRDSGIQFSIDGGDTYPGEVVVLRAKGVPAGQKVNVTTDLTFVPTFYDHTDGDQIALLPVSYFTAVGQHWIQLSVGDISQRYTINTQDKKFEIQNLTVGASTAEDTILSDKANAEYEKVIAPLRTVADNVKRWDGRFILPASDAKVTTSFGMIRYVNGAPTSSRHGALDLAVPLGTNVAATGGGRVLYAGFLQLTGNTVLIEHGYGLKSWYYHMNSLNVKTNDLVEQGQSIGTVGSTGFSTGPHLHFGMSVNNVFINPYTAIKTDLLVE